jgi:amino acid adenylation domain-containing protein
MLIEQIVEELAVAGIYLSVQDGKLLCKARDGALTPERRHLIAERKADFVRFFSQAVPGNSTDQPPLVPRPAGPAPLSPTQQRLWFIDQLTESGASYIIPVTYRLHGALDIQALQHALQGVMQRHEILRTVIERRNGEPVAVVHEQLAAVLAVEDLRDLDAASQDEAIHARMREAIGRPFDLAHEPPLRASLLRLAADACVLLMTLHHITFDGWSVENLLRDLSVLYAGQLGQQVDPLPPLSLQYADYAAWQQQWLQGERLNTSLAYWRKQLDGAPVVHNLPLDRPRPAQAHHAGATWRQRLSPLLHQALLELGRRHGATLFMTLQAAFAVLVARWSGQTDVVIGTPVANRPRHELAPLIGFFSNTLALRLAIAEEASFAEVLGQTKAVVLNAFDVQHLPFDLLVEELSPPRSLGLPPLVQLMFSLQDVDEHAALRLPGIEAEALAPDAIHAKFDLEVGLFQTPGGLEACWDYSVELFDATTIARMGASFQVLLEGIVANERQAIDRLPLLDEPARRQLLTDCSASTQAVAHPALIHTLFEQQVQRTPDTVALTYEDQSFTYAQLNAQANRVAHALIARGVRPDDRVALAVERSLAIVVGILGILKAGAGYVPLDPAYPVERLAYQLEDCAPVLLLTETSLSVSWPVHLPILHLDDTALASLPSHNPHVEGLTPQHLAYVIYTSGSTGLPKGVMVEHAQVTRLLATTEAMFGFDADDVWTLFHSYAFDFSVWELWGALAYGGRLVIVPSQCARSPRDFYALLCREQVTVLNQTPSAFRALIAAQDAQLHSLRYVIFGGEALELHALAPWIKRNETEKTRLINMYGITEITVHATYREITREDIDTGRGSLVGRGLPDLCVYLLDRHGEPVPVGVTGELYVGGAGVARGYWNRPQLTAERFLRDPFVADPQARMYKSGDLGRWLPNGEIEYLGRNDFQVKIRGFRIELGEIEAKLAKQPGVQDAAVIAREDTPGDKRLVAYFTALDGQVFSAATLRDALAKELADYMLPSAFVQLEQLPLTTNGKLDRKALPLPDQASVAAQRYEAPCTDMEVAIAAIWSALLGLERIGLNDNFFELGGHSLLLTRLHNQFGERYGDGLSLKQLFAAPTIREQAALIASITGDSAAAGLALPVPVAKPPHAAPVLSFAQSRLWFIDQMDESGAAYNIPCALRLVGDLQVEVLREALNAIVERHQVLRTVLVNVAGEAQPQLLDAFAVTLAVHDLSQLDAAARSNALAEWRGVESALPFKLSSDVYVRSRLIRLAEREHVLLLTLHHIAADGWSLGVLLGELAQLYEARLAGRAAALPVLTLQYGDYAYWQREWLHGTRLEAQWQYWQKQLSGLPVLHNLPLDFPRPEIQRYRGAMHRQTMPASLLAKLQQLARAHDATTFMLLQTAFAVLLARWSGDTDIVVGSPIAGRRHEQLTPLIGFFVNTLLLRSDFAENPRFIDAMAAARSTALDAYQHQDVPFETLVDRLRPKRSTSHDPLFQIMFGLDNNPGPIVSFGGLQVSDAGGDSRHAKFDLFLNMAETAQGLEACWDYRCDLFRADTIARMAASFETLLQSIVDAPEQRIQQLPLLDAAMQREVASLAQQAPTLQIDQHGVHTLVERQVQRSPDAIAVRFEDDTLTYAQLDRHANQLAHHLCQLGVGPDVRVAIAAERSLAMVISLLAILKAGGAYVPLDPAYPAERLAYMLEDSAPAVLLTQQSVLDRLPDLHVPTLLLDDSTAWMHQPGHAPHVADLTAEHLAYVIYTSGSTGRPKGVMNEHGGVVNRLLWAQAQFQLTARDRVLQKTPFGFDVSVWEFFLPLLAGAQLVMAKPGGHQDPDYLAEAIEHNGITVLHFVPSMLQLFLDDADGARTRRCTSVQHVLCSGEALPYSLQARFLKALPDVALHNLYGPTEAAVDVTYWRCDASLHPSVVPIGRPIANTRMYVLDSQRMPVPRGVAGELYIGGIQVARGYLNRPEQTAERFVPDPFVDDPDARMYKTGDLGRWLPDGSIEYLGRNDFQIKIRGFRIELGEIEQALAACKGVREAAVIAREDTPGDKRLLAYLVAQEGCAPAIAELRQSLAQHLPEYMIPSAFVPLESLPLTPNGKLDRQALPAPDAGAYTAETYVAPETPLEHQLVTLWQDLLQHEHLGVTANFFDLGGHSLNAVRLMSAIREVTGTALPISILFKAPTIRALAMQMETRDKMEDESFVVLREAGGATPLFLFHAAGGDVLCYQPMLQYLPAHVPVYGFCRRELANQRTPALSSTEQLADHYLARLLQQQPQGPYWLAGWSSGGLLAMEVAVRLEALGHTVALVALIDTTLISGALPPSLQGRSLQQLQQLDDQAVCNLICEYESGLPPVTPTDGRLDVSAADYFNYLVAANQISLEYHRPSFSLRARVHYFGCLGNEIINTMQQRIDEIQALAQATIDHESFDATHFSIMEEPAVTGLGQAMARLLDAHAMPARVVTRNESPPHHLAVTGYSA